MMDALQNPNSSMTSSYRSCEKKNDSVQSHLRVEQLWQTGVLLHSRLFTFHLGIHPAWLKFFLLSEILLFPFRQDQNTAFYLERKDKEFSLCKWFNRQLVSVRRLMMIIIQQTYFKNSDKSRAYAEYTIACAVDMITQYLQQILNMMMMCCVGIRNLNLLTYPLI